MSRIKNFSLPVVALLASLFIPTNLFAQTLPTGIAGVVKDSSGAVMPGVTVEASSDVLIEKVRTAVSDEHGEYKITDLRPGTYAVTFSLAGFSTIRREDIELATGFTAKVDADMRVGALEETLTVSGQSPVVDVQNTSQTKVVSNEMLFALPLTKEMGGLAKVTVGVMIPPTAQDVGGNIDPMNAYPVIHGGKTGDNRALLDGMQFNGEGQGRGFYFNPAAAQEASVQLGGQTAEFENGGFQANMVPKDGGNRFSGLFSANYANDNMVSRQSHPGAAGPRASPGQHDQAHLRRQRRGGRPDLPRPPVVLRIAPCVRLSELPGGQLVEPDAEYALLYAGSEPSGDPSAGQRLRRHSLHLSAVPEGQDFRGVGHPALRHLPGLQSTRRAGGHLPHQVRRSQLPAAVQVEPRHEQPVLLRSGRLDAHLQLAQSPETRSAGHLDPQRQHRLPLQRAARVESRPACRQPVQSARVAQLRHRLARVQGGFHDPGGLASRVVRRRRPRSRARRGHRVLYLPEQSAVADHAVRRAGDVRRAPEGQPRDLRAGSVDAAPVDAQPGAALRLLQRLRSRAEPRRRAVRAGAQLRQGRMRAVLAGHQPAHGGGLRCVRQRQDGNQGQPRPIRGGRHLHAGARQQPGHPGGAERLADLDRQQQQLRARLRSGEPERAKPVGERRRRLRRAQQRQLREEQSQCDDLPPRYADRIRGPLAQLADADHVRSAAAPQHLAGRRLLPDRVRRLLRHPEHRGEPGAGRLQCRTA